MWLPEGWQYSTIQVGTGAAAAIVVPAGAGGLTRVLTSVEASAVNVSNAVAQQSDVQVLDGATQVFVWQLLTGPAPDKDSFSDDLTIVATPGNPLTVQFDVPTIAGKTVQQLLIKGYDL